MPELPDLAAYLDSLERRVVGRRLLALKIASPFLLRTAVPPITTAEGRNTLAIFEFEDGTLSLTEAGTKRPSPCGKDGASA